MSAAANERRESPSQQELAAMERALARVEEQFEVMFAPNPRRVTPTTDEQIE